MKIQLKKKVIIPVTALAIALAAAGCANTQAVTKTDDSVTLAAALESGTQTDTTTEETSIAEDNAASATSLSLADSDMFSGRDFEVGYEESESIKITLSGTSASCDSSAVTIEGSTVTITQEGTYILSGTLTDGMIIVDVEDTEKVQLVLDGVDITSASSAAIYVKQADKVFITTASGTANTLTNGGTFSAIDDNNIDAVIFSKEDLTLNGSGTLIINSPAGHGIVSKDSLRLTSGTYEITAASHGLNGKDDVRIANADISITAGKDGIHAENADDADEGFVYILSGTFKINAEGDGISGAAYVQVEDGDFDITAGGGSENAEAHSQNGFGGQGGFGGHGGFGGQNSSDGQNGFDGQSSDSGNSGFGGHAGPGGHGGHGGPNGNGGFGGPNGTTDSSFGNGDNSYGQDGNTDSLVISDGDISFSDLTLTSESLTENNNSFPITTEEAGADYTSETAEEAGTNSDMSDVLAALEQSSDSTDTSGSDSVKGIKATGTLTINGGTFKIDAADDALHANSDVTINGGAFEIEAGDDGMHADNDLTINEGTVVITESYEGLEGLQVIINGGDITLTATDDGINAAGGSDQSGFGGFGGGGDMFAAQDGVNLIINGGNLNITASGDALDSNGDLSITGGTTTTQGPTSGDTSIIDYNGTGTIAGGTFVGTGAGNMSESLSSDAQGVIFAKLGSQYNGDEITVTDSNGNTILSCTPELSYDCLTFSSPELQSGQTYTLTIGQTSQSVVAQ